MNLKIGWSSVKIIQLYGGPVYKTLGGHEYMIRRLSEKLSIYDSKIKVLSPTNGSLVCHKRKGIEYVEVPSYGLSPRVTFPKLSFLSFIIQNLKDADLVHAHCPDNPFVFFLILVSKLLGKPLIVTILAYADDFKHHEKIKRVYGFLTGCQQTIAIWISDKVHVESQYDYKKLHWCEHKTIMIPPGVDDYVLRGKPSSKVLENMKSKIIARNEERIILYLGRIHKAKGLNHAVSALALLKNEGKKVKLVIAGPDNGYLKEIERLASYLRVSDALVYVGIVTNKEKLALLDLSDILIVPSLSDTVEAYSIVTSEAWARGKMIVAYNVGALKYRVKNKVNGYLARPLDQKDLADKIKAALSKKSHFNKPSDVWSWNQVADQWRCVYDVLKCRTERCR
jgi:glycosyltransferase involved in cell wall biosynthesis